MILTRHTNSTWLVTLNTEEENEVKEKSEEGGTFPADLMTDVVRKGWDEVIKAKGD